MAQQRVKASGSLRRGNKKVEEEENLVILIAREGKVDLVFVT